MVWKNSVAMYCLFHSSTKERRLAGKQPVVFRDSICGANTSSKQYWPHKMHIMQQSWPWGHTYGVFLPAPSRLPPPRSTDKVKRRCHILDLRYMDIYKVFLSLFFVCLFKVPFSSACVYWHLCQALSVRNYGNGFLGWLILFSFSSVFAGVVEWMFSTLFHTFPHDLFSSKILSWHVA